MGETAVLATRTPPDDEVRRTLASLDDIGRAIATAKDIPTVKEINDRLAAIQTFLKAEGAHLANQNDCAELRLRARRRLGELLADEIPHAGGRPTENTCTLQALGIRHNQSVRLQAEARIPTADFEGWITETRDAGDELTAIGLRRLAGSNAREEKLAGIRAGNESLDPNLGPFALLYADPPWRYEHVKTASRAVENHYPSMSLDEICELPVSEIAAADSMLFLWATSPKLAEAMQVIEAWGFSYRSCMVWVKDKIGMGYYARQRHELLLIGRRGDPPVPAEADRPASVIEAPRGKHSEKPAVFIELLEGMYPGWPKVELFCRSPRDGWAAWGNELSKEHE